MGLKNAVYSPVCIHHYITKSLEEFIKIKSKRGYGNGYCGKGKCLDLDYYFSYNKKTKDKIKYINDVLFKNRTTKFK